MSVGIYAAEKKKPQDVYVTAALHFKYAPIEKDEMKYSVDYDALCAEVRRVVSSRHYELIENLALCIAEALKKFAKCQKVTVRIDKPLAARTNNAETIYVSVEI